MEDKERELLYGLITQLSQANIQLTMTMMNMFGQMMLGKLGGSVGVGAFPLPPGVPSTYQAGPSIGLGLGLPPFSATGFPEFWKDKEFVNKIMKQFFPGLDDNDKEDLK